MTREHRHEIEIDATADEVWRAVTDADEITRWYADQADVTPGAGGAVTVGWDGTFEGVSRIDLWEPGRRLRLVDQPHESSPPLQEPTVQEWTIQTRGGRTVLRLVHSGFPDTDDWDGIYDSTDHGWDAFLHILRHYLERHPGQPRRFAVAAGPATTWDAVLTAYGLTGDRFATILPTGEPLSGTVVLHRPAKVLLATVDQLDDGLVFLAWEIGSLWAALSAYGPARKRLDGLGDHWRSWMLTERTP